MAIRIATLCSALLCCVLVLADSTSLRAAAAPALTAREPGTPLYARQDRESDPILRLPKGEVLTPIAESVGQEIWYMVRTMQGQIGWVRAADVGASEQVKETFNRKGTGVVQLGGGYE